MLQENSYFSSPFIFFGENEQDQQFDDGEESLFDLWGISLDLAKPTFPLSSIGLFIHWVDINE